MSGGMINTGLSEQSTALSGMARFSAQETQRQEQNTLAKAAQTSSEIKSGVSALSLIAMFSMM